MWCSALHWASIIAAGRGRASKKRDGVGQSDGAHDVSILMAAVAVVGRCCGWQPGAKVSMTIMRPPQQGHCWTCSVATSSSASGSVAGTASNSRALATISALAVPASRP